MPFFFNSWTYNLTIRYIVNNETIVKNALSHLDDSKAVMLNTEGGVNDVSDTVLQHPLERGEQVGINCLYIIEADTLVK